MPDPDRPTPITSATHDDFITRHLKGARGVLVFTALILLAQAVVIAALPWPVMFLIDRALAPTSLALGPLAGFELNVAESLVGAFLALIALALANSLLEVKQDALVASASQRVVGAVRSELLSLLITRRQSYIDSRRRIDLLARISGDAANLEILITSALGALLKGIPLLALVLGFTIFIEPRFSLIVALALPLMYGLVRHFTRATRERTKSLRSETALFKQFEQDVDHAVSALASIKSLNLESIALESLEERCRQMSEQTIVARRTQGHMTASLSLIKNTLRALALLVGGSAVARGELSLGSLMLLLAYTDLIARPVRDLAHFASTHSRSLGSLERIDELYSELKAQEETQGSLNTSSLPFPDANALHFDNVSFAFEGGPLLLEDFSADFQGGELIAVLGPSGLGKSTLGRLMNRLLDPIEGRIVLGRTDIRRYRLQLLRNTITLIRNEPFIVEGSVRKNLLLGLPDDQAPPDNATISEALHCANLSDVVASLPDRLETAVGGARGAPLAFDQLKRLHLARAFLRPESRVFIFDHPTTDLDAESAALIFDSVRRLTERGALVFWVTHRLEDVVECDRVVFFNSRHPAVGTHETLVATNPAYRAYFTRSRRATTPSPAPVNV